MEYSDLFCFPLIRKMARSKIRSFAVGVFADTVRGAQGVAIPVFLCAASPLGHSLPPPRLLISECPCRCNRRRALRYIALEESHRGRVWLLKKVSGDFLRFSHNFNVTFCMPN